MNPEKFDIAKLRIASPCAVGWDSMRGDDRKRFCASCELSVYNVAGMTADQVRTLVGSTDGRLCIRLMRRPDGTVITQDCPVGVRTYQKRVARFAGATLAAVLGLFSISFGQKAEKKLDESDDVKIVRTVNPEKKTRISGRIVDANDAVVAHAVVLILDNDVEKRTAISNDEGEFQLDDLQSGKYTFEITSPGFKKLRVDCDVNNSERLQLTVRLEVGETMGILVIADFPVDTESPSNTRLMEITPRKKP